VRAPRLQFENACRTLEGFSYVLESFFLNDDSVSPRTGSLCLRDGKLYLRDESLYLRTRKLYLRDGKVRLVVFGAYLLGPQDRKLIAPSVRAGGNDGCSASAEGAPRFLPAPSGLSIEGDEFPPP
jgi:hypothetical protein